MVLPLARRLGRFRSRRVERARRPAPALPLAFAFAFAFAALLAPSPGAAAPASGGLLPPPPPGAQSRLPVLDAAEGAVDDDGQEPRVRAELVVDGEELRPGHPRRLGVRLVMDPGWHIYWRNPGEGAAPTELAFRGEVQGSGGGALELAAMRWPAPARFSEANGLIVTYGYAGEVLLFTEATLTGDPDDLGQAVDVGARVDLLACETECIPASFDLSGALPVAASEGAEAAPPAPPGGAYFDHFAGLVPDPPAALGATVAVHLDRSAVRPGDDFRVVLEVLRCAGPPGPGEICPSLAPPAAGLPLAFIPDRVQGVSLEPVAIRPHPTARAGLLVELAGHAGPDDPRGDQVLAGVLRLDGDQPVTLAVEGRLPRAPAGAPVSLAAAAGPLFADDLPALAEAPAAPSPADEGVAAVDAPPATGAPGGLVWVLLFAFLGGLVLNLMPCVLPVLAIKAFSFTRLAHEGRGRVLAHAAAYTGGIVASLWLLATAVVALRTTGTELGWGFQLQEPVFVAAVAAVLVVFALNLFGVFEVTVGDAGALAGRVDQSRGLLRSAGEGVLAVVLATPCSAPFLGTAVGFAFASGAGVTYAVFTLLGLGLAAPFVVLVLVPGARRIVPRPGPWMDGVRRGLGFALLATVVWLAWVLGRVTGTDGVAALLALLLAVAFGTWLVAGARGSSGGRLRGVRWAIGLGTVVVAGFATLPLLVGRGDAVADAADGAPAGGSRDGAGLVWRPFDAASVDDAVSAGRLVFVDFTADWCITCKVNERLVLADEQVVDALGEPEVMLFKADWTQRDEAIRAELARHGKAGVPLYLVYAPGRPDAPEVLPEVLTVDRVLQALARARRAARARLDTAPADPGTGGKEVDASAASPHTAS